MKPSTLDRQAQIYSGHAERLKAWLHNFEASRVVALATGRSTLSAKDAKLWKEAISSAKAIIRVAQNALASRPRNDRKPKNGRSKQDPKKATIPALPPPDYGSTQVLTGKCTLNWNVDLVRDLPSAFPSLCARSDVSETDLSYGCLRAKVSDLPPQGSATREEDIRVDQSESSAFKLSRCRKLTGPITAHLLEAQEVSLGRSEYPEKASTLRLPVDQGAQSLCTWLSSLIEDFPNSKLLPDPMPYLIMDLEGVGTRQELGLPQPILSCGPRLMQTEQRIPGIHTPYAYISQSVSPFSMHVEDAGLPSANILYTGHPKLWIVVAPHHRTILEERLKATFRSTRNCSQFVRHLAPIISPRKLTEWSLDFSIVVQQPGELVITLPFAYHFGFNLGPNRAEAINLTLDPDWLPPKEYRYCSTRCTSHPITADMLSMRGSLQPPQSRESPEPRRDELHDDHNALHSATQRSKIGRARSMDAVPIPPSQPFTRQSSEPPSLVLNRLSLAPPTSGLGEAGKDQSSCTAPKSSLVLSTNQEAMQKQMLDAYRLGHSMKAATVLGKRKAHLEEVDEERARSTLYHPNSPTGRKDEFNEVALVLSTLPSFAFFSHRFDHHVLDSIWRSRPDGFSPARAFRVLQIAVDVANPRILADIRTALRQPRLRFETNEAARQESLVRTLAKAYMDVSNQIGFVIHTEVAGGALAYLHYFVTFEVARKSLSKRLKQGRDERNNTRQGSRATPISDGIEREFGLKPGQQRDAADLLRSAIVRELIELRYAYDQTKTRGFLNDYLRKGQVLYRVLNYREDSREAEGVSSSLASGASASTALLLLFPGEAKEPPELRLPEGSLTRNNLYTDSITMKEILGLPFALASWLGKILLLVRPELRDLDLSLLLPLIRSTQTSTKQAGTLALETANDMELRKAWEKGGDVFQSLFTCTL